MHRILYIEDAPAVGGSAICLEELARGLDRSRFEPFVLFAYDLAARASLEPAGIPNATAASIQGRPEPVPPEEREIPLPGFKRQGLYRLLRSLKSYLFVERERAAWLAEWIARERFDLVHANNALTANLAAIVAASRAGVPAVSHQRGYFRPTAFQRFAARGVDRFLCVSRSVADHYAAQGLRRDRIVTVYDGIDVALLRPRKRAERDRALIGWAGRFVPWKGAAMLVDAAATILARRSDADFVIAGAGPELAGLRKRVERSTLLRDRVHLPGFLSDVRHLIADCDVFVNTSIEPEPLGHSALEAMALGVPVVASACGGLTEIVAHETSGLLFEPGDTRSLADALLKLLDDRDMRFRFGIEGRRRAEQLFSLERHVKMIEAVYDAVIGRSNGGRRGSPVTKP
ncbi:MAG: glycosyltransferase family 4 protein [Candidatus Krumholzibacteria bacterium]|nr:glycosyltransferase family 4 protein [Candidatus Krumholzibacteria bacterium]